MLYRFTSSYVTLIINNKEITMKKPVNINDKTLNDNTPVKIDDSIKTYDDLKNAHAFLDDGVITLKLNLSDKLDHINKIIADSNNANASYRIKLSDNNKALILNKKCLQILNDNGIKLNKVYISYNKNTLLFNTISKILSDNKDVFTLRDN